MEGILHTYHPSRHLTLFEFTPARRELNIKATSPNVLLFVGGMFDNFGSPTYVHDIASLFPRHANQQWSVMHVQLSSAMRGFGISSLDKDIDEISTAIKYIRTTLCNNTSPTNIVLMGHSTGCQDTLHYLSSPNPPTNNKRPPREPVQGAILQAPVSDREALQHTVSSDQSSKTLYDNCLSLIDRTPQSDHSTTLLPMHWTQPLLGPVPLNITRFLSLASPGSPQTPSPEDLLSLDLPPDQTAKSFGQIGPRNLLLPQSPRKKSLLILISDQDEFYTPSISSQKTKFLSKWADALSSDSNDNSNNVDLHPESRCIPNAKHDVSGSTLLEQKARLVELRGSVLKYIDDVVGGVDEESWEIYERDRGRILTDVAGHSKEGDNLSGGVGDIKL